MSLELTQNINIQPCEICGSPYKEIKENPEHSDKTIIWECGRIQEGNNLSAGCPYTEIKLFAIRQSHYALRRYVKASEMWMHDAKVYIDELIQVLDGKMKREDVEDPYVTDGCPSQMLDNADLVMAQSLIVSLIQGVMHKHTSKQGNSVDMNLFLETLFKTYALISNEQYQEAEQYAIEYLDKLGISQQAQQQAK